MYSLGEMIGSTIFGRWMTIAMRRDPGGGPKRALLVSIALGALGSAAYVGADVLGQSDAKSGPALVVAARLTTGVWTGGKMVVEQTYIGEASAPERTTQITSSVGVYAVLGFVMGPTIGAIFSPLDWEPLPGLRIDQYTAPGYFMVILCCFMLAATAYAFDPAAGYARPREAYGAIDAPRKSEDLTEHERPNRAGLATLLACFFAHFYSFAIQETITTPFVSARFEWSQRQIDYLFAGVGLLSLLASLLVARLAHSYSDVALLVVSLLCGLFGSLALLDQPLAPPLATPRFLVGFALITVAFPFGRNVCLAMFSKVLGPTPQGSWFGLMFVIGALPRCLGPSWSLYALTLSCHLFPFPAPCPHGGRTCLEFGINGALFAACLALVFTYKHALLPYDLRRAYARIEPPRQESC